VAGVLTEPADLPITLIADALADSWAVTATALEYLPVGFGSHHWLAADGGGAGLVVAPVPATSGAVLLRLTERYSLAVHPYLDGAESRADGTFASPADRLEPWDSGPYGERARALLVRDGPAVAELLAAYDGLAQRVAARPERMVITHGQPHGANVLRAADGFVFVHWESVLLAPPERDLWGLAETDPSVLAAYSAAKCRISRRRTRIPLNVAGRHRAHLDGE
jgi:spectinomycin phosphotransferase